MTAETFTQPNNPQPELHPGNAENVEAQLYHYASGKVTVHGVSTNYAVTVPTDLINSEITAYVNGLGAFDKTMWHIRSETSSQGTAALSMAPIRRSKRSRREDVGDASRVHTDTISAIFDDLPNNKQLKNIPNGDRLSFNKVNLAAHSYGGDPALNYGLEHPENVSNIVFIQAIGLENPTPMRFIPRLPAFVRHELLPFTRHAGPDFSYMDGMRALVHFLSDPFQTFGEIRTCMQTDNRPHLPTLRDHKIGLAILTGARDHLIPTGPTEDIARHMVDYFEKLDIDHLGPQNQPRKVAAAVIRATLALENKKIVANTKSYPQLEAIVD